MGRGNACVFGKYEGLYYVDWDNFPDEYDDEDGNPIKDYDWQREECRNSLDEFASEFKQKYKSFSDCDGWINRNEKAVLENNLFYIVAEDNEWSIAIKLIQKKQDCYSRGNIENLQKGLYQKYLDGMKECLFNQFEELGAYGGPWTSERIRKSA